MIGLFLMVVTTAVALVLSYRLTVREIFGPTALFHYLFAALILFRPLVFLLGLDRPFPDALFARTPMGVFADTLGVSLLWLGGFVIGHMLGANRTKLIGSLVPSPIDLGPQTIRRTALSLTFMAVVTTGFQAARAGGVSQLIRATKVEKLSSDVLIFRSFAVVATVFALAYVLHEIGRNEGSGRRMVRRQVFSVTLLLLAASASFAWGARDSAVIALVGLVIGPLALRTTLRSRTLRLFIGGAVILSAVVGLRVARDVVTFDTVSAPLESQSFVRQVSVAANLTQFDSYALAIRDWPGDGGSYRYGEDFTDGLLAAVPPLRPNDYQRAALWWAQEYEPDRANGYPLTSIGEWYLNFGIVGAAFGGVLAGWLYRALDDKYQARSAAGPLSFAISLLLIISFVRLGPWTAMPVVYRTMVLPTLLVAVALRRLSRPEVATRTSPRASVSGRR